MDVKLKVVGGPHAGKTIPLNKAKFLIGRADDCHLRPGSDMVSRHHCALLVDDSYVEARDFGSKNGTYINGERVSGVAPLQNGDLLKIGPLEFELVVEQRVGGPKLPPVKDVAEVAARTAASTDKSEENDIGDWLSKDSEPASTGASSGGSPGPSSDSETTVEKTPNALNETQHLSLGDTGFIEKPQDPNKETKIETPEAENPPPPKGKKAKPTKPGKLPPIPKQSHKDSSNAAADVLRNMMRRR